jgi:hypothetical protein
MRRREAEAAMAGTDQTLRGGCSREALRRALRSPSVLVLIAANLVPVYGVLFLDWSLLAVILLFWAENVVVGAYNVLRMLTAMPRDAETWNAKALLVPFFMVHYGFFAYVHGSLIIHLFGREAGVAAPSGVGTFLHVVRECRLEYAIAALAFSHGFSFVRNYIGKGEIRRMHPAILMFLPYGRVAVLHVGLLAGAFAVELLGEPIVALLGLVVLKIGFDVVAHTLEHAWASGRLATLANIG